MLLSVSLWFLAVLIFSFGFLVVLGGSWRFLVVLGHLPKATRTIKNNK